MLNRVQSNVCSGNINSFFYSYSENWLDESETRLEKLRLVSCNKNTLRLWFTRCDIDAALHLCWRDTNKESRIDKVEGMRGWEMDWKFINVTKHYATMLENISFAHKVTLLSRNLHYFCDTLYCSVLPIWTNSTMKENIYPGIEYFLELPYVISHYEFIYPAQWFHELQSTTNEGRLCGNMTGLTYQSTETFRIRMQLFWGTN